MNVIGKFALGREVGLHKNPCIMPEGPGDNSVFVVVVVLLFGWAICGISPVFESPNIIVITI